MPAMYTNLLSSAATTINMALILFAKVSLVVQIIPLDDVNFVNCSPSIEPYS